MSSQSKQRKNLYQLVLCAVLIALATVLGMIKFLNLPYGGSSTLMSMLAASLCGYYCGAVKGVVACTALGLLNFILEPTIVHPAQVILDYFLAFGLMGLSVLVSNRKHGLVIGYLISIFARFLCSFLSGFIFFASYAPEGMNPLVYSFIYNIIYIGAEGILTLIVINIPVVRHNLEKLKQQV